MGASALFGLTPKSETEALAESILANQTRIEKADAWFADSTNANHPRFAEFGRASDQISRELGDLTAKAYELGLYWDGQKLIPWADALNPAAVASKQPQQTLFTGTQITDLSDF